MKLHYTEIFYSLQGEGARVGVPSVFLRLWGCNFQCPGFGQDRGEDYETLRLNQEAYIHNELKFRPSEDIADLPAPEVGCDSSPSWSKNFRHLKKTGLSVEVAEEIEEVVNVKQGIDGPAQFNDEIDLIITGGEPLILGYQTAYIPMLERLRRENNLQNLTFETNGTFSLNNDLKNYLNKEANFNVTWMVSPKLSGSGHSINEACKPQALQSYASVKNSEINLKFVVKDQQDLEEISVFLEAYKENNVGINSVYVMPEGASIEQINEREQWIAEECMKRGYRFSPRLQNNIWGNTFNS